jgi:hypothetical protein
MNMKFRLGLLIFGLVLAMQAQTQMNIAQLVDFIRSSIALKQQSDKQVANYLKKDVTLTERLTDKTIEDLRAQGAEPKTLEALRYLRDQSANVKQTASPDLTHSLDTAPDNTLKSGPATASIGVKPVQPPPPNSVQQEQILDSMRQYAMSYASSMPNFVCVRVDRRFVDPRGGDAYRSLGTVLSKVTYHDGQESYKVYSDNGRLVDAELGGMGGGGARSSGEYAGLMRSIFDPKSDAEITWAKWGRLRDRTMVVFNYFIDSGHSSFSIDYGDSPGDDQRIITAYKGLVYADANTGEIDRITFEAVDIPASFPVRSATDRVDYDLVDIGGEKSVLPIAALLHMSTAVHQTSRNEIEFRNYHKYGSNSIIRYDTDPNAPPPPPLPDSKTQEQPVTGTPTIKPSAPAKPGSTSTPSSGSNPWSLPTPPPPPPQ